MTDEEAKLKARADKLDCLVAEMIGCLRTNVLRCTLASQNDEELERMIDAWAKRREEA